MQILIVDDQSRARQSLKALLNTWPACTRIREAGNGSEALIQMRLYQPEMVLLDARILKSIGAAAAREIKLRWPQTKLIILAMFPDCDTLAAEAGADALISKGETPSSLLAMLASLSAGVAPLNSRCQPGQPQEIH